MQKTESHSSLKMEPTRPCVFCTGDHWNDQCEKYRTAEERKQRSKWRCYICLLSGHRAFECVSNIQGKQKCYYCKRRNHHHRSLCQWKFGLVCNQNVKSTNLNYLRDANTQTDEKHELVSDKKNVENIHFQSNRECEFYLIRNDLAYAKLELAECKKEIDTLKDNIIKSETERKSMEESVRVHIEVINQQKEEISRLRENHRGSERHNVGINIPEKMHRNIEGYGSSGADLEMNLYLKEEKNKDESDVVKRNTQRNGKLNIKKQGVKYSGAKLFDMVDKNGEYSISNTTKTFSEDSGLTEKLQSPQEGIRATNVQNGMNMLNSIQKRQTKLQNYETASFDIDSINEQSVKAYIKMLSILSVNSNHSNQTK